jgi:hypothetical protein
VSVWWWSWRREVVVVRAMTRSGSAGDKKWQRGYLLHPLCTQSTLLSLTSAPDLRQSNPLPGPSFLILSSPAPLSTHPLSSKVECPSAAAIGGPRG